VQIIGLTKPDAIKKIIAQHPDLDLIYYRSLLNDKPWQVIVLAGFSDYADANSQRRNLPESLAINKPWIKSVAKVKDEIRAALNQE
jgi:septal ring-binding cell division protein DamX